MSMNLMQASNQWRTRPDDERFESLDQMRDACYHYFESAREAAERLASFRIEPMDATELALVGQNGGRARFSHWSFGQFCRTVSAPADFMRTLPTDLAANVLNHGLRQQQDRTMQLLLHQNGSTILRAFNGAIYSRIWNWQIADRLLDLQSQGWQVPPARPARSHQAGIRKATEADVLRGAKFGLSIRVGDAIAPAGIYASDHDCFVFMVDNERRIDDGSPDGLGRGFFIENSEVGDGSFVVTAFLYRHVCGNHIVWGAEKVTEIRLRHAGQANVKAWGEMRRGVQKFAGSSAGAIEEGIREAKRLMIGENQEETVNAIFAKNLGIPKGTIEEAYEQAIVDADENGASPNSRWGMVNGLTKISQERPYGDARSRIDRAAGKLMKVRF